MSFLYRFQLLRENFPNIPFYNTQWNAGYSAREFFPSGILNVFLFFWPFVYFAGNIGTFADLEIYNWVIPYIYIGIVPWSVYLAAKILRLPTAAAVCGALFSIGPSLSYFEWLLRYGTLGFSFATALVPLGLALSVRLVLDEEPPRWVHVLGLLVVSFCCVAWTLCSLVFVPIALMAFLAPRLTWSKPRGAKVLVFLILFAALNGPWIAVFFRESKVISFLQGSTLPGSHTKSVYDRDNRAGLESPTDTSKESEVEVEDSAFIDSLTESYLGFRAELQKVNPVLLLLFLPGFLLLPAGRLRLCYVLTLLWLFGLAAFGDLIKPQLELRRMIIPASFLLAALSGAGVSVILQRSARLCSEGRSQRFTASVMAALVFGFVLISPLTASAYFLNRSQNLYRFVPQNFRSLTEAISEFGGDGRTFFLGFILHEFGATNYAAQDGGHIAPLASLSGKELYASDFYHTRWSTVDPIPSSYRARGTEGTEEFLDLLNVTAAVTFKSEWRDYCRNNPRYTEVYHGGRFRLFTRQVDAVRKGSQGYFQSGRGEIRRARDGFLLKPEITEMVLRYRHHPQLRTSNAAEVELYPHPAFSEEIGGGRTQEVSFIGVRVSQAVVDRGEWLSIGFFAE